MLRICSGKARCNNSNKVPEAFAEAFLEARTWIPEKALDQAEAQVLEALDEVGPEDLPAERLEACLEAATVAEWVHPASEASSAEGQDGF